MFFSYKTIILLKLVISFRYVISNKYQYEINIDDGLGRTFDGIGAISGGGATSKLLINYPEPHRSHILDYLFKPNFGASLHILKVEIGGDSQSTDGSESSHMHSENDLNYQRGYEWWLMKEAKHRNPDIKLYGLPWVFPGWLGGSSFNPFSNKTKLVSYFINWVKGADKEHGLKIDYLGIWNERPYDVQFFPMLRKALDTEGYKNIQIVGGDNAEWTIANDYMKYNYLNGSVDIIGIHYPGITGYIAPQNALDSKLPLWASEEYSAYNDWKGGACWARVLTSGYPYAYFSAYIAWNLIASYYNNLPYSGSSLMTANEPWSGSYNVNFPIWTTAHHTQFTKPGWKYLKHGQGSGVLKGNGTYVTLFDKVSKGLTIIVQTMDPILVPCFYPMPKYTVANKQMVSFQVKGTLRNFIKRLHVWQSNETNQFIKLSDILLHNGEFSILLEKNQYYTFTTISTGRKGSYGPTPISKSFPLPYFDNFESYEIFSNPYNIAQQSASFEVVNSGDNHGKVLAQVVTQAPVDTCLPQRMKRPVAVIGNYKWKNVAVKADVLSPSKPLGATGIFIAVHVDRGGCDSNYANGLYLWIMPFSQSIILSGNYSMSTIYHEQSLDLSYGTWYTVELHVWNNNVLAQLNNKIMFNLTLNPLPSNFGFVALGTTEFKSGYFDNLEIHKL